MTSIKTAVQNAYDMADRAAEEALQAGHTMKQADEAYDRALREARPVKQGLTTYQWDLALVIHA